jgi:hypothetical protein
MSEEKNENWDLEDVLDNEVSPLLKQIKDICEKHKIPFITSFTYKHTDDGHAQCTSHFSFEKRRIEINAITSMLLDGQVDRVEAAMMLMKGMIE